MSNHIACQSIILKGNLKPVCIPSELYAEKSSNSTSEISSVEYMECRLDLKEYLPIQEGGW